MRKPVCVAALMLALCLPALAGEIPNPPAPQPQGVTVAEPTDDATLNGEMHTPGIIHNPGVSDILAEAALDLLAVLPTLL
jgi:hypothetical protein